MHDDQLLSERLTRALGHCVATFARANPTVSTRAVMAAYVNNLCTLGELTSPLEDVVDAVRNTWVSQARPPPGEPDAPGS